jgi:hypothetical protein
MATAGRVDFPDHMKTIHQKWLDDTAVDTNESSMVDAMNAALGASPYSAMTAYDPATSLASMDTVVSGFDTIVGNLAATTDWESAVDSVVAKADANVFDDTYITADIAAFGNELDDQIDNIVLPRFQGGLRDINAVMSPAFVIGESIIEGMRDRDVAKYGTDLRVKFNIQRNDFVFKGVETILRDLIASVEFEKSYLHYAMEAARLRIVSEKEKKDTENNVSISDGRWDIETFQYGANLLAAIGGGTMIPSTSGDMRGPSKTQSAIGGALAGAAAGGMVGGGWGALVGGALGGLGGLF